MKRYGDIIAGVVTALTISAVTNYDVEKIQLCNSIIILMLVCIGIFKVIKQSFEKSKEKRKQNIIDDIVNGQKSVKAVNLAQSPTREGEKIGKLILNKMEIIKRVMNKIKTFFEKFKGYILAISLGILTIVEMYGDTINTLCGDIFVINGVKILPIITLVASIVVGIISNGFTKEQAEKIKALFSKSSTNEIVSEEIKKTIKEDSNKLTQFNKLLISNEHELSVLNTELKTLENVYQAKKEMYEMIPQLATNSDVQLAFNKVSECKTKIIEKETEIKNTKTTIEKLQSEIKALKSQL